MKRLEDDADALAAKARQRVLAHRVDARAVDDDAAAVGPFEPGDGHQQRRFARARRADQADRLAAADCQTDAAQDMDSRRALAEAEVDVGKFDRGFALRMTILSPADASYGILRRAVQAGALALAAALASWRRRRRRSR